MPGLLIRVAFTAAVAGAAIPAWSAGMPEFGTKNFSPGGDAPSYFSNENGVVNAVAGEAWDDGDDGATGSVSVGTEPDRATSRFHGRFAAHQSSDHSAAYVRSSRHFRSARPAHYSNARDTAARSRSHGTAAAKSIRHAWARPSSRKG
jgi:hypothetical protein